MPERNYFARRRRGRSALKALLKIVAVVVVIGALVAGGAWFVNRGDEETPLPTAQVDHYLTAWTKGDGPGMAAFVAAPPADLGAIATSLVKSVPGSTAAYQRTSLVLVDDSTATATYHALVRMP